MLPLLVFASALAEEPGVVDPPLDAEQGPPALPSIPTPLSFELMSPSAVPRFERKARPLETDDAIIGMIRTTVDEQLAPLRKTCWEARLADFPELYGAWQLDWVVTADGAPKDVVVTALDVPDAQVAACIAREAATWRFLPIVADTPAARRVTWGAPADEDTPDVVELPN